MAGIFIESTGAGEPILFIHGLGGTSNVFAPQVGVLSRFFACHRFDLPGAGLSPSSGENTIEALVDATIGVMDTLALSGPVHVVAHSMGTVVAQHLALKVPDRVASLSLIGPVHAPGDPGRAAIRDRAAKVRADGMASIADAIVTGGTSLETRAARPEVAAFVREIIMRQDAEGYARHCEALAGAQAADVARIEVPVLLVTGDEDNTSPAPASTALTAKFPDADLVILGRTGHWTTFERAGEVSDAIVNFLFSQQL
ncbi:alpha/beta fold hydrolase [Novosphingobium sp. BL-52-GroH]|uniref:alpha/beta fold hydrolase n=1 Tax=Novosphingobium sp. BL-52-GroH TaxID=3349877 RepID=UPI00384B90B6